MKKNLIFVFMFSAMIPLFSQKAQSQSWSDHWTYTQLPLMFNTTANHPYFVSENVGFFIGLPIYRTTDGGAHWVNMRVCDTLFTAQDSIIGGATLPFFTSDSHGYISVYYRYAPAASGMYETQDAGAHWKRISDGVGNLYVANGIFYTSLGLEMDWQDTTGFVRVLVSSDGGRNWDTTVIASHLPYYLTAGKWAPGGVHIFGNNDNIVYIIYPNKAAQSLLYCSTDKGKNWSSNILDSTVVTSDGDYKTAGTRAIYPFPCSNALLRIHQSPNNQYPWLSTIESSTDFSKTWTIDTTLLVDLAIAGDGYATYLWDAENSNQPKGVGYQPTRYGFFRSIDFGKTWSLIPGPSCSGGADDDVAPTWFTVFNCGSVILTPGYDTTLPQPWSPGIWKTRDGSDGSLKGCFSFTLFSSARLINDSVNITIHLPIYFHHSGTMNDVDMIMHYPTGALKYLNGISYDGKSLDVAGSQWAGRAALHFAAADLNAAPDSLLGYANFLWTPFEYDCSEIIFDSIDSHGAESPCSISSEVQPFKGIIGSFKTCGLSGVAANNIKPPDFSIHPNPATKSIQVEITNSEIHLRYELFDALGNSRKNGTTSDASFKIDVSELAAGNYYLRISGAGAVPVTRRVVVAR